jgi:hypothetical protein
MELGKGSWERARERARVCGDITPHTAGTKDSELPGTDDIRMGEQVPVQVERNAEL